MQKNIWKNLTGTAVTLGVVLSSVHFNDTPVPPVIYEDFTKYRVPYGCNNVLSAPDKYDCVVYRQRQDSRLEIEARKLFGPMREATDEESGSVKRYVESISKDTGFNFFDLC